MIARSGMKTALISFVLLLAPAYAAGAADADDVRQGRELARQICADCHAVRPAEVQSPNRSAPSFEDIAGVSGISPIALKVALRSSHREMPNLILNDDEIDRVIAYILSLPGDRR
jgi:mono/diheme cytochrome c family protein